MYPGDAFSVDAQTAEAQAIGTAKLTRSAWHSSIVHICHTLVSTEPSGNADPEMSGRIENHLGLAPQRAAQWGTSALPEEQ